MVVAALEAMNEHDYHFYASTASTGGSAPLLIVSGPIVDDIGMNAAESVFGPGNRANATIGRAIRLVIMNVFGMVPGVSDLSTQGHPGKYSFCIAERADRNPLATAERGARLSEGSELGHRVRRSGPVQRGETIEATRRKAEVLDCFADVRWRTLGCLSTGQAAIVMSPEHALVVSSRGWTKRGRQAVPLRVRPSPRAGHAAGSASTSTPGRERFAESRPTSDAHCVLDGHVHRGRGATDILVTVAGGDAGAHLRLHPVVEPGTRVDHAIKADRGSASTAIDHEEREHAD